MAAALTAVLPLKTVGSHYAENLGRCDLLMASLRAFSAPGLWRKIYVICPGSEARSVERAARAWQGLPIEVTGEDDLLPFFDRYPKTPGWFRQQLIKLNVASSLDTDFFLTLDPDVLLCKPVTFDDLCPGGRALTTLEPRRAHPEWWAASAALLGAEPDLDARGLSVTPALLSREICLGLAAELGRRHGVDWRDALLAALPSKWTEYTLYWLAAQKLGLADRFHLDPSEAGGRQLLAAGQNVWSKDDWASWRPERCFDPAEPGFFCVVQSNTRVPPDAVARRIAPHLAVDVRHRAGALGEIASVFEDARRKLFGRRGTPSNRT
jgi:uncharacterized protein DUF6492